jgi:protein-tyrosine phosphatase
LRLPQVLEFRFPGHPAPPLGLLFKMCTSLDAWLEADPTNVAVLHCLTGKGRTATVSTMRSLNLSRTLFVFEYLALGGARPPPKTYA